MGDPRIKFLLTEHVFTTLFPCSTETREVLGNPSPTAEKFPETGEVFRGRSSREILRTEGIEGIDFPSFGGVQACRSDILSSSIFLQPVVHCTTGVDQEILPGGQGRIDNAKVNPILLMMRECEIVVWGIPFPKLFTEPVFALKRNSTVR